MKKEKGSALELYTKNSLNCWEPEVAKILEPATFLSFKVATVEIRRHVIDITSQPGPALGFHTLPQASNV
jgi:hypothetical protein